MSVELHLGDCLSVMEGLADGSVDAVIADPPYGARRPPARRAASDRFAEVQNNDGVYGEWLKEAFRVTKDGGAIYVFVCWDKLEEWKQLMARAGFRVRSCIVWNKDIHGLADLETCWAPCHEMILFAAKGRHVLRGSRPVDVIHVTRVLPQKLRHPYEKPVHLITKLIRPSTPDDGVVLDPFMGSGTTGVACAALGRRFIGIELDPAYYEMARRRIAGDMPLLAG
jgi:DNA modification methylase